MQVALPQTECVYWLYSGGQWWIDLGEIIPGQARRASHCVEERSRGAEKPAGTSTCSLSGESLFTMSKAKTKNENKTEKALAAEKEQFNKQQVSIFWYVRVQSLCEEIGSKSDFILFFYIEEFINTILNVE